MKTILPNEFGGDVPMTRKQKKFWKAIYFGVIACWLLAMVAVALQ